jgi:hypothetical protein
MNLFDFATLSILDLFLKEIHVGPPWTVGSCRRLLGLSFYKSSCNLYTDVEQEKLKRQARYSRHVLTTSLVISVTLKAAQNRFRDFRVDHGLKYVKIAT